MIGFGAHQRFFIHTKPVDMRKGIWSLAAMVRNELKSDPLDGSVYVFFSKNKQTVKLLVWDKDGFAMYYKCLERGRFESLSQITEQAKYPIAYPQLVMLLSGISLVGRRQRKRYEIEKEANFPK
jgi:transposase